MEHKHLSKEDLISYYYTLSASHPWKQAHKTAQEYADFVSSQNKTVQFGGHTWKSWKERRFIRQQLANKAVNTVNAVNNTAKNQAAQLTGDKTDTVTPPASGAEKQDVYASHYEKSAARPTVVNINIGELAHFDRTSVASSAQERDLMAAMEEKIAESIYRISMTAFNNASSYMS